METRGEHVVHVAANQVGAIGDALRAAQPNTTIVLGAGVYTETSSLIVTTRGLTIVSCEERRSDGTPVTCIIASSLALQAQPLVQVDCAGFSLQNVSLELLTAGDSEAEQCGKAASKDCKMRRCITILQGNKDVVIKRCQISCLGGIGIEVANDSAPLLDSCVVSSCTW